MNRRAFAGLALTAGGIGIALLLSSAPQRAQSAAPPAPAAPAALVARGEYLTRAADCAACHTVPGGKPFAGGYPF